MKMNSFLERDNREGHGLTGEAVTFVVISRSLDLVAEHCGMFIMSIGVICGFKN